MSQPPAMTVAVRQALVRQLIEQDSTLSARAIAGQIGVGKDTVLRDLDAIRRTSTPPAPDALTEAPHDAPEDRLVLVLDEPLRQALAVLRATRGRPDTDAENVAVARAAIRATADTVFEARQHAQEGNRT